MMTSAMDNLVADEVIKRRLLVDGDGVGDDRRILALMKNYIQFCTTAKDMDQEQRTAGHRRLLSQLHQIGMSLVRTKEMIKVNEGTREMFVDLGTSLRLEVEQTKGHITQAKALLEHATKHRKYAMEYDALAKLIHSQPDRKATEEKRNKLLSELGVLKNKEAHLAQRLNSRRQNMTILTGSIERLKELINDEDNLPHPAPTVNEASPMDIDETPTVSIAFQGTTPMELDNIVPKKEEGKKSPKAKPDLHDDLSE